MVASERMCFESEEDHEVADEMGGHRDMGYDVDSDNEVNPEVELELMQDFSPIESPSKICEQILSLEDQEKL